MDSMPDEKYSMVLSECWVVVFLFILDCQFLVVVAVCAMAARFFPAEVPMMVPKNVCS